ncbi:hypothetical protein JCM11641_001207 [Rhodosporidiobolus odoratus]
MASLEDRLKAASTFLLQSPPGEVNDVFSDIRTLVSSDPELELGILPALKQYNKEQFTLVSIQDSEGKLLLTPVSLQTPEGEGEGPEERHVDPKSGKSWLVDQMKVIAHSPLPLPTPDQFTESLRLPLQTLLSTHVKNHYNDGHSAVYALEDPAYPAPTSAEVEGTGKIAEDVQKGADGETETTAEVAAETAEAAEEALPADAEEGGGQDAVEPMDVGTPAAHAQSEAVEAEEKKEEEVEEKARPSRLFGLYLVGNKYNPANYWTGRWRSWYHLDHNTGELKGEARIWVHYYEQGNVQLTTTLTSLTHLPPSPSPEAIISALKSSETQFSRQLSATYSEMSEQGFKGLRRALPKTKSKLEWEKVGAMRFSARGRGMTGQ